MEKIICFDIGNVIVTCDVDRFVDEIGIYLSPKKNKKFKALRYLVQTQHDVGLTTLRNFFEHFDTDLSFHSLNEIIQEWCNLIKMNNEMYDLILNLKKQNVKIAYLSNIGYEHAVHLTTRYPELFENTLKHFSYEVGARKPTKLYFQSFLHEADPIRAGDCLFIDDLKYNCDMAESLGFKTYQFSLLDKNGFGVLKNTINNHLNI